MYPSMANTYVFVYILLVATSFTSNIIQSSSQNAGLHRPHGLGPCLPDENGETTRKDRIPIQELPAVTGEKVSCEDGFASTFPCRNINLLSFLPTSNLTGTGNFDFLNDIWGWTNPKTNVEYALVGMNSGTSFVDLSDPSNPVLVGHLPTQTFRSHWRDVKVYNNHAFVVSEANLHGMQVFDMTQLEELTSFTELRNTAYYNDMGLGQAHNLFINEDSGIAYIVGANEDSCSSGGLHMVDVSDPTNPTFVGCYADEGYTHDVQCVMYDGPDTDYVGREICFGSNEDHVVVLDATDKSNVRKLSTIRYYPFDFFGYTHQGWLTDDRSYFLIDDEVDELHASNLGANLRTKTVIADVSDLCRPRIVGVHVADNNAVDHNLYVKGNYVYQANYRAGLRVLDLSSVSKGDLIEKAYFDVYPADDSNLMNGAWSNYPFFDSKIVTVSGMEQGLFVLEIDYDFPVEDPKETFFDFFEKMMLTLLGVLSNTIIKDLF